MNSNQNPPTVTFISLVAALEDRLQDCIGSEDYVVVIRALVATGDPAAIRVLAALGDDASKQWLRDDDAERIAAYLERRGSPTSSGRPSSPTRPTNRTRSREVPRLEPIPYPHGEDHEHHQHEDH
jgi:hypothetical protein